MGDCLKTGGTPERPEVTRVDCGSPESNFKVAATRRDQRTVPGGRRLVLLDARHFLRSSTTICMDIDWVVGDCMSIDPNNDKDPLRADCNDSSVPNRQRATQILEDVADVDQCASGVGYPYDERNFTVCVEDVT